MNWRSRRSEGHFSLDHPMLHRGLRDLQMRQMLGRVMNCVVLSVRRRLRHLLVGKKPKSEQRERTLMITSSYSSMPIASHATRAAGVYTRTPFFVTTVGISFT